MRSQTVLSESSVQLVLPALSFNFAFNGYKMEGVTEGKQGYQKNLDIKTSEKCKNTE
jgi:hypothetical protein